ncbi:hypothetical protein PsexTeo8_21180 [Pseudomonas extremaustralis]|uniref:hypothetical protein n=1 Tax=Pseudomonas extremaustralis TaxID=359110 RepID=UPI002AA0CE1E|nr:hypothetical protein [Pseudomonas extremaustralis]MDY7065673.1 hypothetical protein [Pseudomonas extremaustralis]
MNTNVLLSFDLKQNTTTERRALFDEYLEGHGWEDCPDVSSAKTKVFKGGDAEGAKLNALKEVYEAIHRAKIKETSFVIQCGNLEPVSKTYLYPDPYDALIKSLARFS